MFPAGFEREEAVRMFDIVDADHGKQTRLRCVCLLHLRTNLNRF